MVVDWRGEELLREADSGVRPFTSIGSIRREEGQVDAADVHAELAVEEERGTGHVERDEEAARVLEHGRQVAVRRILGDGHLEDGRGGGERKGLDVPAFREPERDGHLNGGARGSVR